jgi:hypothetical protein
LERIRLVEVAPMGEKAEILSLERISMLLPSGGFELVAKALFR